MGSKSGASPGFRVLENQYFDEARRLAEEERKRRLLLGVRGQHYGSSSVAQSQPQSHENEESAGRITPGGLYEMSESGLSSGLNILSNTRHIFIQRAGTEFIDRFFELENRFDLLNTEGQRIFFAGETVQAQDEEESGCFRWSWQAAPFDVSVVGCDGGGILSVVSRASGTATISDFRNILGTVTVRRELARCCCFLCGFMTTYSVKDKSGVEVFKIGPSSAEASRQMEFNVFTTNMKELIGRVSREWPSYEVPSQALWSTAYGISFAAQANIETKALLLGCLIAIVGHHNFKDLGAFKQRDY